MTRTLSAGKGYILINDNQEALFYPTKTSAPIPVTRKQGFFGEINYESELFLVQFSKEEVYLRTVYLGQGNTPQSGSLHIEKNDNSQIDLTYQSDDMNQEALSTLSRYEEVKEGTQTCITYQNGVQSLKTVTYQDGSNQEISFAKNGVTKVVEKNLTADGIRQTTLYNPLTAMPFSKESHLSDKIAQQQESSKEKDMSLLIQRQLSDHSR